MPFHRRTNVSEFSPAIIRVQQRLPSPLPRAVLHTLLLLLALAATWAFLGRLDIVAVAQGRLVPQSFLKIVQPAESGIIREILVREGDAVQAGQVLARMDTQLADADSRALKAELDRRRIQLRRIQAELASARFRKEPGEPLDVYEQALGQYQARRQAYQDTLGTEQAALAKARHDLQAAAEMEEKLRKSVPIYKEQADSWEKLAREGYAGRLLALERRRAYLESMQDLKAQTEGLSSLRALIAQSERRISQITSNYREQLQNERAEAEAIYYKLSQDWQKQQHRKSWLELKAPQAGIVKDLATHTPGTVVAPGTILLTLVPNDEPLIAEVWVGNMDAGFVQNNQVAKVKLAAYPFQKYGMLTGTVRQISIDARSAPDAATPHARLAEEAAYRALIELSGRHLDSHGRKLKLLPGMQVSAEIHLGTRSVIEYLLSPVQKVAHEAGRER